MTDTKKLLRTLKRMIDNHTDFASKLISAYPQKAMEYERIISSEEKSNEIKALAILGQTRETDQISRFLGELSVLRTFQTLATNLRVFEVSFNNFKKRFKQKKILELAEDIEDVKALKEDVERFTELLEQSLKNRKKFESKSRSAKETLSYIS